MRKRDTVLFIAVLATTVICGAMVAAQIVTGESLSAQEQLSRGEAMLGEMTSAVDRVTEMERSVSEEGEDVVRLRCVTEKARAAAGFLQVGSQAFANLQGSAGRDLESASHHYNLVLVSHQRVVGLEAQAQQCVGDIARYTGEGIRGFELDPRIPGDDVTGTGIPDGDIALLDDILPEATPFI